MILYKGRELLMKGYDFNEFKEQNDTLAGAKKILALFSVAAFCLGVGLTTLSVYIANRMNESTGVGGLETPTAADLSEADLAALTSDNVAYVDATPKEVTPDALSEPLAEGQQSGFGEDIESASALLEEENEGVEAPLCYYTYRVKKGDMIGYIADKFDITTDTIISVNDIHQSRLLQIGQYLKIPSMPGIVYNVRQGDSLSSICDKYEVSMKKCAKVNSISQEAVLQAGSSIFIPDAQLDWATKQEINGDLFRRPLRAKYYLSSYFGWRSSPFSGKRSYHSGIDMACPQGTPVYAASSGKVTSAGYNNVYGNYVIITHPNGYKTLYGHMSAILVSSGRNVILGTNIGRVGSTGMSTGPHLHFTVYKHNKTINPLTVIK